MKQTSQCPTCGHATTVNRHSLNQPMVSALRQLVDFYEQNRMPCNLQKHLKLTKNQYNNFQKLQYFGLVFRDPGKGWIPTEIGIGFIYGDTMVWSSAASRNNITLGMDDSYWNDIKKKPHRIKVTDIDTFSYKQREEYQAEKRQQLNLFYS